MTPRDAKYGFYIDAADPRAAGANTPDRESWLRLPGQRPVRIKHPQGAHFGTVDSYQRDPSTRRAPLVLKDTGHVIAYPITSAAGDVDFDGAYAHHRKLKLYALGWFLISKCPCALIANGELWPDHVVDKSIIGDQPCPPGTFSALRPCRHTVAEQTARAARNAELQAPLLQPGAHERMLAAAEKQNAAVLETLSAVQAALEKPPAERPNATPDKPAKGK